jgi:hypothetical protein
MSIENGKTPLEDAISSVFSYAATLQKEINSLQGTQTAEGQERLSELVYDKQPRNEALLEELQEQKEIWGHYLGMDNPW